MYWLPLDMGSYYRSYTANTYTGNGNNGFGYYADMGTTNHYGNSEPAPQTIWRRGLNSAPPPPEPEPCTKEELREFLKGA